MEFRVFFKGSENTLTVVVVNTCMQVLDHLGGQRRAIPEWNENMTKEPKPGLPGWSCS